MNVLQVMGCTSVQYASMERYLVEKAKDLNKRNSKFYVVYENVPKSNQFIEDFFHMGGILFSQKPRNFYDLNYYKSIYRIIKEKDIDIVHSYFTPTCHYLNIYLTLRGLKNLVRTAANLPISPGKNEKRQNPYLRLYFSLRHKSLSMCVRKIICRSKGVMSEYQELGISPRKLISGSGGVDIKNYQFSSVEREQIRRKYNVNNNTLVLGIFCRLVSVKRIDNLIKVFDGLKIPDQDIKLFIAGDGPELESLKRLAKSLKLNDYIKFLGHINDISKIYSALDIFCLPSLAEGMSNSMLEAMASGLPIIASNISSNRELVDEGKGGYLVSFEDRKEFQDRIEKLLDESLRKKMGQHNRRKVVAQFSLQSRIEKEFQIYKELLPFHSWW